VLDGDPGRCVHRDDMDWIIPRWREADVIYLGTPIYNYNIVHYLQKSGFLHFSKPILTLQGSGA